MQELNILELQKKLVEFANKSYAAEKKYIEAKEAFMVVDDIKKIKFAMILEEGVYTHIDCSEKRKERLALISDEWQQFNKTYSELRVAEARARIERDNMARMWETARSIFSLRKQELNKLGGEYDQV